jgi:hypothetical protein
MPPFCIVRRQPIRERKKPARFLHTESSDQSFNTFFFYLCIADHNLQKSTKKDVGSQIVMSLYEFSFDNIPSSVEMK